MVPPYDIVPHLYNLLQLQLCLLSFYFMLKGFSPNVSAGHVAKYKAAASNKLSLEYPVYFSAN